MKLSRILEEGDIHYLIDEPTITCELCYLFPHRLIPVVKECYKQYPQVYAKQAREILKNVAGNTNTFVLMAKATVTCSKEDAFDLPKGIKIAKIKAKRKIYKQADTLEYMIGEYIQHCVSFDYQDVGLTLIKALIREEIEEVKN